MDSILQWVEDEFSEIDLGDQRLNRRLKICTSQFSRVRDSTPERCCGAALKATYRLVDNDKVSLESILHEHNQGARQRCSKKARVYLIQDTTEVDITKPKQQVAGAGPLGAAKRRGFFYHPLYAICGDGIALGVVDQVLWTRTDASLESSAQERRAERKRACFEEKESSRWLEMLQSGEQFARTVPNTQFVHLADSEADISELFCEELPANFQTVIRGCKQHNVVSAFDVQTAQSLDATNVSDAFEKAAVRHHRRVTVSNRDAPVLPDDQQRRRKQSRTAREATLCVKSIKVVLNGPRRSGGGSLPNVALNVIELLEEKPPEGETPIHWLLYTTLAIESIEDIDEVIDAYTQRWAVELYFKTLKSGMKIEQMKYETLARYQVAFAMLSVVAWRIEYLKSASRHDEASSCEKYFQPHEWKSVVIFATQTLPAQPPTVGEFLRIIAQLGGFINKRAQGPPGSQTIWRGMREFDTIVRAYKAFNQTCGV